MDPNTERLKLFTIEEPFETGFLKVSEIHNLYYEISGNKNGKPVLVMHGGPGAGSNPSYRGFFDPSVYRVVQMDQRGAGKSTPHACLTDNTTWHIVEDMEKLRNHLKVEKWHTVFGGSWGSTISLAYAEEFPEKVGHLVLRGIFLLRRSELQFFYQEGTSWIFPDYFDDLKNLLPEVQRGDILQNYYRVLTGTDEELKVKYAKMWTRYEMATCKLIQNKDVIEKSDEDKFAIAFARIETHFFVNGGFMKTENQLLDNSDKLKNIPISIVQGRYDVVCPFKSAWDLYKKLPHSDFYCIQDAGHSCTESGIIDALVRSTEKYKSNN
jgi:proline iminopeptidase